MVTLIVLLFSAILFILVKSNIITVKVAVSSFIGCTILLFGLLIYVMVAEDVPGKYDRIKDYEIVVEPNLINGNLNVTYEITWKIANLMREESLASLELQMPNEYFDNVVALSDNIERIDKKYKAIEIYFYDAYEFGEEFTVKYSVDQPYTYALVDNNCIYDLTAYGFPYTIIDNLQIKWNAENIKYSDAQTVENGYLVWNKTKLKERENFQVRVEYDEESFKNLDSSKSMQSILNKTIYDKIEISVNPKKEDGSLDVEYWVTALPKERYYMGVGFDFNNISTLEALTDNIIIENEGLATIKLKDYNKYKEPITFGIRFNQGSFYSLEEDKCIYDFTVPHFGGAYIEEFIIKWKDDNVKVSNSHIKENGYLIWKKLWMSNDNIPRVKVVYDKSDFQEIDFINSKKFYNVLEWCIGGGIFILIILPIIIIPVLSYKIRLSQSKRDEKK